MKTNPFHRLILRQKMTWILNTLCLSLAFAVFFIVMKQVSYDLRFDACYPKAENIYQLGYYNVISGTHDSQISYPIIPRTLDPVPEVEAYAILWSVTDERSSFYHGESEYKNTPYYGVSPGFLKVFQPRIIAGDAQDALENKTGLLIPQSLAKKWFGDQNPVGQVLGWGSKNNHWPIKAVYEDFPENSTLKNAIIVKMNENKDEAEWSYTCFFRVGDGVDIDNLEKKLIQTADSMRRTMGGLYLGGKDSRRIELRTLSEFYFLPSANGQGLNNGGNKTMTLSLLIIGIMIVLIAYVNFINFSTAQAPSRMGTLNICKISGASSALLRWNIIREAILLSIVAWVLAFLLIWVFSGTALAKIYFTASLNPIENIGLYLLLGGGVLVAGCVAGLYPAYYSTSFQPALALKGSFALGQSGRNLRNGLLLIQFIVSILLVTASLFVLIQNNYLRNQPVGYQKENIVYFWNDGMNLETLRSELKRNPGILDVTASRFVPGNVPMRWGRGLDTMSLMFYSWPVASNFLSFFGIRVYEGEDLRQPPAGTDYAILNRKMVEKFGLHKIIGQEKNMMAFKNPIIVTGFAENVNFASLHHEIEPMAFVCGDDMWNEFILVKIRPEGTPETIRYLKKHLEDQDIQDSEIHFLDATLEAMYVKEENLARLILLFCLITVVISLSGIYGLVLFNVRYKVKEIGMRRTNGAERWQIMWMLNLIFIRLIVIAGIIAIPLAYLLVNRWLVGYPYHTPVHAWVFLAALLVTLLVTLLTVGYQSWKAASINPVDALRNE